MNDRELLEAAAKALGANRTRMQSGMFQITFAPEGYETDWEYWNPLTDDGDALRLAVKLRMDIAHFHDFARANIAIYDDYHENNGGDPCAATRRAIVRAAAEMGRNLPQVAQISPIG